MELPDEGSKETEKKKKEEEEEEEKDPLEQQFKNLEQEWSLFKQSNPRSISRCSSDEHYSTTTTTTTIVNEDYFQQVLLNKSPRDLMSSLQRNDQKQNDWAIAELLKERWDAIASGRLKGRRLFEDEESGGRGGGESEMCWDHDQTDEDICSECFNLVYASEKASVVSYGSDDDFHDEYNHAGKYCKEWLGLDCSYCSSLPGSSWSEEEEPEESGAIEETQKAEMQVEAVCGGGGGGIAVGYARYWKIWIMIVTWFGVPLLMHVLGIMSRKCAGGYAGQEEAIDHLVPT